MSIISRDKELKETYGIPMFDTIEELVDITIFNLL